ncbi:MAG: antibiotic transporter [Chlamydia sp. 32-24]|nr:MAG: antibiotic transporter [Chlamydia sp. 32-24]
MDVSIFSISIILFLIMDPIGNVGSYLTLMQGIEPKRIKLVLLREMVIALAFMIFFSYLSEALFDILQVSEVTVSLSSGLILFLTAIKILFPTTDGLRANLPKGEPFVIPLAVPLIAGPSLLATILLFSHLEQNQTSMLIAIFFAWISSLFVLYFAPFLNRYLGKSGLMACERLMGMILVMLAIQRFMEGVYQFIHTSGVIASAP